MHRVFVLQSNLYIDPSLLCSETAWHKSATDGILFPADLNQCIINYQCGTCSREWTLTKNKSWAWRLTDAEITRRILCVCNKVQMLIIIIFFFSYSFWSELVKLMKVCIFCFALFLLCLFFLHWQKVVCRYCCSVMYQTVKYAAMTRPKNIILSWNQKDMVTPWYLF